MKTSTLPLHSALTVAALALCALGASTSASANAETNTNTASSPLIEKFDTNKDGVLSGEEIPDMLSERMERVDTDGDQRLDAAELAKMPDRAIQRMLGEAVGDDPAKPTQSRKPNKKPGEVYAPAAREEFDTATLKVGDPAPDFTLPRSDGPGEVTLSSFEGKKPVVLVFGSITCSPFRQKVAAIPAVHEKYADRAEFFMIYIREAHPESVVEVTSTTGSKELKKFVQTDDFAARLENAQYCAGLIRMPFPTLVDGEDNRIKETYAGWPIRLMVIGTDGKIDYDGGLGPKGFEPSKLDAWLAENL